MVSTFKHNQPISEQYRVIAEEWADAYASYKAMEDAKTTVLEKIKHGIVTKANATKEKITNADAERLAKVSDEWCSYLEAMGSANARRLQLQVQKDVLNMRHHEQMSVEANHRRERGM